MNSEDYLNYMRAKPCAWCLKPPRGDAHHFGPRGIGLKANDFYTCPLCRGCHTSYHQTGRLGSMSSKETKLWFYKQGLDALIQYIEERWMALMKPHDTDLPLMQCRAALDAMKDQNMPGPYRMYLTSAKARALIRTFFSDWEEPAPPPFGSANYLGRILGEVELYEVFG